MSSLDELISISTSGFWQSLGQMEACSPSFSDAKNTKRKSNHQLKENNAIQEVQPHKKLRACHCSPRLHAAATMLQKTIKNSNTRKRKQQHHHQRSFDFKENNAIQVVHPPMKSRKCRISPRLHVDATLLQTPQATNSTKKRKQQQQQQQRRLSESSIFRSSISSHFSFSQSNRSVHLSYEPPSVKRRKLRRSSCGQVGITTKGTTTPIRKTEKNEKRQSQKGSFFCPLKAAKQKIQSKLSKLEDDGQNTTSNKNTRQSLNPEQLALGLKVWDKIANLVSENAKVEAIVAGMAVNMELSHVRLTRFLQGDTDNHLPPAQVHKISEKLEAWVHNF